MKIEVGESLACSYLRHVNPIVAGFPRSYVAIASR